MGSTGMGKAAVCREAERGGECLELGNLRRARECRCEGVSTLWCLLFRLRGVTMRYEVCTSYAQTDAWLLRQWPSTPSPSQSGPTQLQHPDADVNVKEGGSLVPFLTVYPPSSSPSPNLVPSTVQVFAGQPRVTLLPWKKMWVEFRTVNQSCLRQSDGRTIDIARLSEVSAEGGARESGVRVSGYLST